LTQEYCAESTVQKVLCAVRSSIQSGTKTGGELQQHQTKVKPYSETDGAGRSHKRQSTRPWWVT